MSSASVRIINVWRIINAKHKQIRVLENSVYTCTHATGQEAQDLLEHLNTFKGMNDIALICNV